MANLASTPTVQILIWNVKGLGDPRKRHQVLAYLDRHQIHIAMLQETHINPKQNNTFANKWADYRIFSSYSSYSRGTAILIKKTFHLPWPDQHKTRMAGFALRVADWVKTPSP